ncbi:hypothetical protein V2J09_015538 [Rumex salicifolius]
MSEGTLVDEAFPLFSKKKISKTKQVSPAANHEPETESHGSQLQIEKQTDSAMPSSSFADLGLAEWALNTCTELGMKSPRPVQFHCIPKIIAGCDVLGLAQTGTGKTAAFALPILHRLAENPYGVFALVITPTRELAYQLAEHFRALGSCLHVRVAVVVGGMDKITQATTLMRKPHIVVATPGRIKVLLDENPDIASVFSKTKFLVLDEADRVLDVGFEDELKVIFKCLPKNRQTLLFSATMTPDLQTLLELSGNKAYFFEAYEGLRTVDSLTQKTCHLLNLLLEQLDQDIAALHSYKSQSDRLTALHHFKSGHVPILLATDVASRGLDIPTVDLVINYDIPRDSTDYVHRVGRTARAGRGGMALSMITQNDVDLIHKIEADLGKKLEEFECKENDVLANLTKVYKAKRVVTMKMLDDGFEDKVKERRKQKMKTLADKGLLKKSRKRKRVKAPKNGA